MGRRNTLTDDGVAKLKPRAKRYAFPDPELAGHYVRVTPKDAKSYCAVTVDPNSKKQVWATIGSTDLFSIDEARRSARTAIRRIRSGLPAFETPTTRPATFTEVSANWIKRHVKARGLITQPEIERLIEKYLAPKWKDRTFATIRRGDVTSLLDDVADDNGPSQADAVLAVFRSMANWYATRHEDYVSPLVRGMRRTATASRKRILTDDELCIIWSTAESGGNFGAIIRLALLTAQRREKVAGMAWADVVDGEWNVPRLEREKGTGGPLILPPIALQIIGQQPHYEKNAYVFPGRGKGHFNGFSPCKRRFDDKLPKEFAPWTVHDLRRTARSLMSRAGIRPEIAERVMGHAIGGVEGTYDRHEYRTEKKEALSKLALLIDTLLDSVPSNVLPFREPAE